MRWFRFAVLILFATILQASFLNIIAVGPWNIRPDLLIILLVFFAIYCNTSDAITTSFVIGFAADIIGPTIGPSTISFLITGTLLAYLHRVVATRRMPYQAAAIFIISILCGILTSLLTLVKGQPAAFDWKVLAATSAYSALIGPFLFLPSAWWARVKTHRFGKQ